MARGQLLWAKESRRHPTRELHWGRRGKRHAASGESAPKPLDAWAAHLGGKRRAASGESVPKPLAAWTTQAREGTKRRRNRICTFVKYPKTGTALNTRPAPYTAAGSLSIVDGESTDTPVWGKPSVAGTQWVLCIHSDICLQRPALPVAGLNWTSEPK